MDIWVSKRFSIFVHHDRTDSGQKSEEKIDFGPKNREKIVKS